MKLASATAILTGASSGLGTAIGSALIKEGTTVYGLARNLGALNKLQDQLGESFIPVRMDITESRAVEQWIRKTFNDHLLPDVLINNAGAGYFDKVDELPLAKWHQMMDTNLSGVFYLTRMVVPLMKQNASSSYIINIGSILGKIGSPERSAYCATKFAISGFSESLFKELRYDGIKVSCINPGSIETEFFSESGVEAHSNMLHPEDLADTVIHVLQTPDNMLINEMTIRPLNPKPDS